MDKRLGVYVCSGCSIGESVDVEQLTKAASSEYQVPVCRTHPFLCGEQGLKLIHDDLEQGSVNAVVVAACSPRVKTRQFAFNSGSVMDRVNLREQVAWCHEPRHEDTQMLAEDLLRMGIVRAQKMEPLEALAEEISRAILVVGGGLTGITAALEAADAGFEVVLVEKQAELGGMASSMKRDIPSPPAYTEAQPNRLAAQIKALTSHPRVKLYCSSKIVKTEGQPGRFDITLESNGEISTQRVGAILLATGWKPYDATKLTALGYGLPDVVTNFELETMAAEGSICRPSTGEPVNSVLFVQCAGSRDPDHLPYCSSTCCVNTLKQTEYIREQNPEAQVFIVYKDMMTPGAYEKYYQKIQEQPLNFFVKGTVTGVERCSDGRIQVGVDETLLGLPMQIPVDLVVLATGMVPNSADGPAIRTLHDAELKVLRNESDTQREEAEKVVEHYKQHAGTEILNLSYRQGPDLPVLQDGFPDSHFVCFPYETLRTGIYAAGAVRAPMDSMVAREDARGAVMKSIQCIQMATHGEAVHPRAGDLSYPSFFLQRCTSCKRCTEECPFGSIDEDEKGTPKFNPYRCRRCGICMGACPERIISFKNYSVDMIASMVKAIEVPDETEDKPRILVFACENDAYPALDIAGMNRASYDASVRVISLRCLGTMNIVWIADALSRGIDGVLLLGCKFGDDYQCHFVHGSELANRRLENVKDTLNRLQLESDRVRLVQIPMDAAAQLPLIIDQFAGRIRELGPNPYKGF
jgi:quinone-modifying oxidoreductase, subunit QmoB